MKDKLIDYMNSFYKIGNKMVNIEGLDNTSLTHTLKIVYKILKDDIFNIVVGQPNEDDNMIISKDYAETLDLLSVFTAQHIKVCNSMGIDLSDIMYYIINKEYQRLLSMLGLKFSRIVTKSLYPKFEDSHKAIFEFKYDLDIVDYIYDNIINDIQSIKIILKEIQSLITFTIPIIDAILDMKDDFKQQSIKKYRLLKQDLCNVSYDTNDIIREIINVESFNIIEHADYDYVGGNNAINNIIFSLNCKLSELKNNNLNDMEINSKVYRSLHNKIKIHRNNYKILKYLYNSNIEQSMIYDNMYTDMEFKPLNSIMHTMYHLIYLEDYPIDNNVKKMKSIIDMYYNNNFSTLKDIIIDSKGKFFKYDITIPYAKGILNRYEEILDTNISLKMKTVNDILSELNNSCFNYMINRFARIFNKDNLINVIESFYMKIIPREISIFGTYNSIAIRHIKSYEEIHELILSILIDDGNDEICKEAIDTFITSSLYKHQCRRFDNVINILHDIHNMNEESNDPDIQAPSNIFDEVISGMKNDEVELTLKYSNDKSDNIAKVFIKTKNGIYNRILKQHSKLLNLYNNK